MVLIFFTGFCARLTSITFQERVHCHAVNSRPKFSYREKIRPAKRG